MITISYNKFRQIYLNMHYAKTSYRFGQAFITLFVKEEDNTVDYDLLWNTNEVCLASDIICNIILQNQWDWDKLVVIDEQAYKLFTGEEE